MKEIKPVALAIIKLSLSEGIGQLGSQPKENRKILLEVFQVIFKAPLGSALPRCHEGIVRLAFVKK